MTDINSLPNELLLRIFKYYLFTESQQNLLKCLSQVCKKWEELCMDSSNFQTVDGSISTTTIIKLAEAGSLKLTKSLKFGRLPKAKKRSPFKQDFKNFYANLPRLKSLNLANLCSDFQSKKEHSIFTELKDFCPDLCELVLGDPKIKCKTVISHSIFVEFLHIKGQKLVTLDFSYVNIPFMRSIILLVANTCPNLEDLIIQNMMTTRKFSFPVESMQIGCPKLKNLCLDLSTIFNEKSSPKTTGFPLLETFIYPYRDNIEFVDTSFSVLLSKSPKLKTLDIRGSQYVSVEEVHSLCATDLEELYLSYTNIIQKQEMVKLLQKWSHSLKVIYMSHSTKEFFNEILGPLFMPDGLPELESLDVNCTALKIHTLQHIIQHSPKLSFLDLQQCRSLERKLKRIYRSRKEIEELLKHEVIDMSE